MSTPDQPRHGPLLVVTLGLMTATGPLSLDMYLPALPEIAASLDATPAQVQVSLTSCLIGLALGQLIFGPLSDRWGRRRPAIAGFTAYALISVLIALSPSASVLTGLRLLQGLAGGVGVVVARAMVRDLFAGVEAAKFFSRLTMIFAVAPIAAPVLGSAVLGLTSWHGVFVALGVIAALLAVLIVLRLPETLPPERRSAGGAQGLLSAARTLFTDRIFVGYALAQALSFGALFSYIAGGPFVIQDGYGLSPTMFSILFGVNSAGLIIASQLNGRLLDRFSPRTLLIAALILQTVAGAGVLAAALAGNLVLLCAALFLLVGPIGMVTPNAMSLAMDRYPHGAGATAALLGAFQWVLGAVAAPLSGSLGEPATGGPMGTVTAACALLALGSVLVLTLRPPPVPETRPAT